MNIKSYGKKTFGASSELFVSNHISWLDIFALNSENPARFVAKSEVGSWPFIGALCKGSGTVFIKRDQKGDIARVNREISALLHEGENVAFFPEGTSSDGRSLRPFKSSLLQSAINCEATIQPIYLRYVNAAGIPTNIADYCDDISFGESLRRLLSSSSITIELYFLPQIPTNCSDDRRTLIRRIESSIKNAQTKHSLAQ